MARIDLKNISYSYDPTEADVLALRDIDHSLADGSAYALLGPSGCGKTTLLNIISGIIKPTKGRVLFDEKDVTQLGTESRNIAQVFQFPVVYDTMSVYDNLAFPLKNRKLSKDNINKKVKATLKMLDLTNLADKRASGLTADLKQKISLGRGMVRENVAAILFDEPLTVMDPHMKLKLRIQLKLLHKEFGHTMVYVTHDQTEALTFADKVIVMFEGQIVQFGTPAELYETPDHSFVGYFIGSPGMNFFDVTIAGNIAHIKEHQIKLSQHFKIEAGKEIQLGIRPDQVKFDKQGIPIKIDKVEDIGREKIVRGSLAEQKISIVIEEGEPVPSEPKVIFNPNFVGIFANGWRIKKDN